MEEDKATSDKILDMINETIDEAINEAIGTAEVQESLRRATGYDRKSYNAAVKLLHKDVRSNLRTQFTSSNFDEAARYAAAIREALNQLREYVNKIPDYQTLWSTQEATIGQARQKMALRKQLDNQRIMAEADETLAAAKRPSRKPFWKANRLTESGKLNREIARLDEELPQIHRKVADATMERRQFELRVWPTEPNYAQQSQKVADARRTLFTFVLEASLPILRTSIQEYAADPTHFD
jgi:hypothetical protein